MNSEFPMGRRGDGDRSGATPGGRNQTPVVAPSPLLPVPPPPLLRPIEISEMLDEAFDLYRRNFRLFFGITLLLYLPTTLLQIQFPGPPGGISWADWLPLAAFVVALCPLTVAAWDRVMGVPVTIVGVYRQTLRNSWYLFLGGLGYCLVTAVIALPLILPGILISSTSPVLGPLLAGLGFVVFLIPGSFLSLWGMLLVPVIVAERCGFGALARCRRLATGNLWRVVFLYLGLLLVGLIFLGVLGGMLELVHALTGTNMLLPPDRTNPTDVLTRAGFLIVDTVVQAAWLPLTPIACLLAYLDLRVRREAYDLELLTAAVETRVGRPPTAPAGAGGTYHEPSPGTAGP
jgi:hypothetical protein